MPRHTPPLACFVLVALALHGLGIVVVLMRGLLAAPPELPHRQAPPPSVWTTATDRSDPATRGALEATREAMRRQQATPKPLPPVPPPPLKGTVVDLPPSQDRRPPPPSSAYLAEANSRADRESRSRHGEASPHKALNEPRQGPDRGSLAPAAETQHSSAAPQGPQKAPSHGGMPPRTSPPPAVAQPREAAQDTSAATTRSVARDQQHGVAAAPQPLGLPGTGGGHDGGTANPSLSMAQLVPSMAALSQMGGGPKNDVGLDVPEAEGTFLNARAFKYASFFNRLKEQIGNYWRPLPEYARRDPSGNIYGTRTRLTVLTVALDHDGGLQEVRLAQSCGIDFLDEEGLRAIRAAAPFMHPPKGLLDHEGRIVFNFAFTLDMSGAYRGPP